MVNFRFQDSEEIRCAWTISRATAPAVVRNRLRRWGRIYLRQWSQKFHRGVDFNLIFKRQDQDFYRHMDHSDFDQVLKKVVKRFEEVG